MLSNIILALLMLGLFIQAVKNRDWAILKFTDVNNDGDKDGSSDDSSDDDSDTAQDDADDDTEDDSDTDDSDDSENDEGAESIAKKYFTDPKSLDPKLRTDFKRMQGIFTRKMQEVSQIREEAEAFKTLVADPDFRKWAADRRNGSIKKSSNKGRRDIDDDDDNDIDEDDKPVTLRSLKSLLSQSKQEESWQIETEQFKKAHPDWEVYKSDILAILKRAPSLPLEDAYYLATRDIDETERRIRSVKSKKDATISKPSRTGGKSGEKKGKMTIEQAFELAKKKILRT